MNVVGSVAACWRYPVKSLQGFETGEIDIGPNEVKGDRQWGFLDKSTNKLMSAKRYSAMLGAAGFDEHVELPGGDQIRLDQPGASAALSAWLGVDLEVVRPSEAAGTVYQMTFDPPNDDAEYVDIPTPSGTFLDLAPLHLISTNTLAYCRAKQPELDWDVRRFRPNLVVDLGATATEDADGFTEEQWVGRNLKLGTAVAKVMMPTVRCAMPLRAQPDGLERQPQMFKAMSELNTNHPNHLGLYLDVVQPGTVRTGDTIEVFDE